MIPFQLTISLVSRSIHLMFCSSWAVWRNRYQVHFKKPLQIFASCLPGLECTLHSEVQALNLVPFYTSHPKSTFESNRQSGGIAFRVFSLSQLFSCHLYLGSASHILIRCGETFIARDADTLSQKVMALGEFWNLFLPQQQDQLQLDIRVTATRSRLYHTKLIAQSVEKGIRQSFLLHNTIINQQVRKHRQEQRVDTFTTQTVKILVRIDQDLVQLSIDSSNTPLHRRGYKLEMGKAPLREDLAYALVYNTIQTFQNPAQHIQICDPFCGSGTIVLEAAALMQNLPPGRLRSSPVASARILVEREQGWKDFVTLCLEKRRSYNELSRIVAMGSDRDAGVVQIAWNNAQRAGLLDLVTFQQAAISNSPWLHKTTSNVNENNDTRRYDKKLVIITNPPFGKRISPTRTASTSNHHPLLPLYQTLGNIVCRNQCPIGFLANDVLLARRTGIPNLHVLFTTKHGGLTVSALNSNGKDCMLQKKITE